MKRRSKTKTASPLGPNIATFRHAKNLTQLALAHLIGYNGPDAGAFISRVEAGKQTPRVETIQRIAEALGVTVCDLLS